jgi:hypothetical protein
MMCGGSGSGKPSLKNPIDIYPITRIPHQYLYAPFNAHCSQLVSKMGSLKRFGN